MNPFTFSRRRRRFRNSYFAQSLRHGLSGDQETKRAIEVKDKISDKETSGHGRDTDRPSKDL